LNFKNQNSPCCRESEKTVKVTFSRKHTVFIFAILKNFPFFLLTRETAVNKVQCYHVDHSERSLDAAELIYT